jgi:hypothetical protein
VRLQFSERSELRSSNIAPATEAGVVELLGDANVVSADNGIFIAQIPQPFKPGVYEARASKPG